ncbi:Zn-ribbon domain-containing OB-fold protein [Candidatus Nitrosotenuis sp. DW1]|uniref:Zn-ribbon domain-containing OB-fold protein n=1 Tax=Candidatus Nitrosotenuis sp. DW1 TaxID=2259672 RepID=UPI0015C9E07A|nr:OB-fold domain-containing protein [Candidatus Nitrosotenuis sp. DW1]QLH08218.1 nucleotide-binding protein [Candidatus Nitrosotenuis sp. DW1]
MSNKQEFIDAVNSGKILARKCTKCGNLHLATVYFCQQCGHKEFESKMLDGIGTVATYTIITVPPAGFEKYTPYAWVVMNIDNYDLRISGFLGGIVSPSNLPIGSKVKIVGYDDRGILLEKQ